MCIISLNLCYLQKSKVSDGNIYCYWNKVTKNCYNKHEVLADSLVTSRRTCSKLKQTCSYWILSKKICHELTCSNYSHNWKKCNKEDKCYSGHITKECLGKNEVPSCNKATLKLKCNKLKKIKSKYK